MNREEIWKDIDGFNNKYQVSNFGRVKSITRYLTLKSHRQSEHLRTLNGRILKAKKDKDGYLLVSLGKNNTRKIHRLVAQAFIENPNNYPCVNHKDENPCNNCVYNLEWCTHKYNNQYGSHSINAGLSHRKKVMKLTTDGNPICIYNSIKLAEYDLGIKGASTMISRCCKGKIKSAYNFKWIYYYEDTSI